MNNKKALLALLVICGAGRSIRCMQKEISVEDALAPYATRHLLKLAQERPGLFMNLLMIWDREMIRDPDMRPVSGMGWPKTLIEEGFMTYEQGESYQGRRIFNGVTVLGLYKKAFPLVISTLRELALCRLENEAVAEELVKVQLPIPSAPEAPDGFENQCDKLALEKEW